MQKDFSKTPSAICLTIWFKPSFAMLLIVMLQFWPSAGRKSRFCHGNIHISIRINGMRLLTRIEIWKSRNGSLRSWYYSRFFCWLCRKERPRLYEIILRHIFFCWKALLFSKRIWGLFLPVLLLEGLKLRLLRSDLTDIKSLTAWLKSNEEFFLSSWKID